MKSDLELVEEVRAGNRLSFSELVRRHQKGLLRLAVRFTKDLDMAEDIVQDSFVKCYQKLSMFEGRSSFKSWLYRIAINTAKNKLRSEDDDKVNLEDVNLSVAATAEKDLTQESLKEFLLDEVAKLPDRQRVALTLRVYEDLSFKEIAQIMECPYDTAKANYRHALMKLREILNENKELADWEDSQESHTVLESMMAMAKE